MTLLVVILDLGFLKRKHFLYYFLLTDISIIFGTLFFIILLLHDRNIQCS